MFCGGSPLTAEHVIPQWISRRHAVYDPSWVRHRPHVLQRTEVEGHDLVSRPEIRKQAVPPAEMKVRAVCGPCNNGWLSSLEDRAAAPLGLLIDGAGRSIKAADVLHVAAWAAKTAMMFELNDPQWAAFTSDQRADLFATKTPPRNSTILVGRYQGGPALWPRHVGARLWNTARNVPAGMAGITSLALGKVVFVVVSAAEREPLSQYDRSVESSLRDVARLWPASGKDVRLPQRALMEAELSML